MLGGIIAGGGVRLVKYGLDIISEHFAGKTEEKNTEKAHQFEMEKIKTLKEQEVSIAEYKNLTSKSETERTINDTEKTWIENVLKSQSIQVGLLQYFAVNKSPVGAFQCVILFFIGIGNFITLLSNIAIQWANVFKNLQKEVITLLVGYAVYRIIDNGGILTPKEVAEGVIVLFESIVAYNFFDKSLQLKKKA
jgi:hypothetical protein